MFDPKLCPKEAEDYFWRKTRPLEGCLVWEGVCSNGTPMHWVSKRFRFPMPARQLAWAFHYGKPFPEGVQARTTCGNSRCVDPEHVRLYRVGGGTRIAACMSRTPPQPCPAKLEPAPVIPKHKKTFNDLPYSPHGPWLLRLTPVELEAFDEAAVKRYHERRLQDDTEEAIWMLAEDI